MYDYFNDVIYGDPSIDPAIEDAYINYELKNEYVPGSKVKYGRKPKPSTTKILYQTPKPNVEVEIE